MKSFNKKDERNVLKERIIETLNGMGVTVKNIILFGSPARGDYSKNSDYDFLIITEEQFEIKEKMKITKNLRTELAEFAVDFIIKSEMEIELQKEQIGTLVRETLKEGINL